MIERTRPYAVVMPPSEHNHFVQLLTATLEKNELPVLSKSKVIYTELLETYLMRTYCNTSLLHPEVHWWGRHCNIFVQNVVYIEK